VVIEGEFAIIARDKRGFVAREVWLCGGGIVTGGNDGRSGCG
jgi:hypothetical protein